MSYNEHLEQISRNSGFSPRDSVLAESFYGIDINGRGSGIPLNTENYGYTFFTRPCLNLSYDNIVIDPVLQSLLNPNPNSMQGMVRATLDSLGHRSGAIQCTAVDPKCAFINILGNNLVSLSGWDDFTLGLHTSEPGLYREAYSYIDDVPYNYTTYDTTGVYRNLTGDPITFMHYMWGYYGALSYEGRIMPYPDFIIRKEIEYDTRIYRLAMDATRTYVTRLAANGAGFPYTAPIANAFNFTSEGSETPFTTHSDQVSVSYRCMGFTCYNHILIFEFNEVVEEFNNDMRVENRERMMTKLKPWERDYFNRRSYPRINPATMELEWWVPNAVYNSGKSNIVRQSPVITK